MKPTLEIKNGIKQFRSENYNFNFRISDGYMEKWGKTVEDDPVVNEFSPELADLEITTICHGPKVNSNLKDKEGNPIRVNKLCSFCYKSNTPDGKYMLFETFKQILNKFPSLNTIKIEFNNNEIIEISENCEVILCNGDIKLAKDLKENDDINILKIC